MSRRLVFPAIVFFATVLVTAAVAAPRAPSGPVFDWPQILRDPKHTSYDPDKLLTVSNAPSLGLNWMSALRSADLGSPVINYNVALQKTVAYVGDERGDVTAFDESNGTTLWSTSVGFGDSMRASPLVDPDGAVWVATAFGSTLYKLDGSNGAVQCSVKEPLRFNASPMVAKPPGGVPTVFIATNYVGTMSGPTIAVRVTDCATLWSFDKYKQVSGAWATAAYSVDAHGNGRIFVGTADPDTTMYALDALTGALVWDYTPQTPGGDFDIGAAATVSSPGNNGFADGVLYFPTKYGIMYALDLTTGKPIWHTTFDQPPKGLQSTGRSSAALENTSLVFGMSDGVYALDATTGKKLWHYTDPSKTEIISSPAIVGPSGSEIVTVGDTSGALHVLRLTDGRDLYDYQTGNYITSSPAVVNGHILIDSTDGFLYDFTAAGGNARPGTTAIAAPANDSKVANPKGMLTVSGSAVDRAGLTELQVAIQAGGPTGPWYDGESGTWVAGAYNNFVSIKKLGAKQSTWSFQFPVPPAGSSYLVEANAVDYQGQVDRKGAQSSFGVLPNRSLPQLTLSDGRVAPGETFNVSGTGFKSGETVTFALQGVTLGQATAGAKGAIRKAALTVSSKASFGISALVASGETSGKTTTASIDISNIWSQLGYDATRASYEPNDSVLADTLEATGTGYVSRAWLYTTGAPVNASPAVVAGAAYVGNDAGTLASVDTSDGAPFWSYTTPSGMAIHGSPAVDHDIVTFGADDGTLYTLASATGSLVGTVPLDGNPAAPAILQHTIYVATDNGTVYAIDDIKGTLVWSTPVGAAIHMAPAVDGTSGLVVVGDDTGNVTELNAATGAIVRQLATGAAVTATPIVAGGYAYVASSDGYLRVVSEATLSPRWKFSAGSPIRALSLSATGVYVGGDNGFMYDLAQKTGNVTYALAFGAGGLVGIGSTVGVPFIETASGDIGASKDDQQRVLYGYQTGGNLSTSPAIVDGAVFVGAGDGGLYAFTSYGGAPQNAIEHHFLASARAQRGVPSRWSPSLARHGRAFAARAFAPFGPRDYPLHLDRPGSTLAGLPVASHGSPPERSPRSYVIAWSTSPAAGIATAAATLKALRAGAQPAGAVVDTTPMPIDLDDASVQREIAREILANHWKVDVDAQIFVITSHAPRSNVRYCDYRSAFHPNAAATTTAVYAVISQDRPAGCSPVTAILTHLQSELQTNPLLNALK